MNRERYNLLFIKLREATWEIVREKLGPQVIRIAYTPLREACDLLSNFSIMVASSLEKEAILGLCLCSYALTDDADLQSMWLSIAGAIYLGRELHPSIKEKAKEICEKLSTIPELSELTEDQRKLCLSILTAGLITLISWTEENPTEGPLAFTESIFSRPFRDLVTRWFL